MNAVHVWKRKDERCGEHETQNFRLTYFHYRCSCSLYSLACRSLTSPVLVAGHRLAVVNHSHRNSATSTTETCPPAARPSTCKSVLALTIQRRSPNPYLRAWIEPCEPSTRVQQMVSIRTYSSFFMASVGQLDHVRDLLTTILAL